MSFNFSLFSLTFFLGSLLALYLAFTVYLRRPAPGCIPFMLFILAVAWWTFAYALEAGAQNNADKILWGKLEYFGIVLTGLTWLCFTLDFTGQTVWRKARFIIPMLVMPLATLIAAWTNQWHGWMWSSITSPDDSSSIFLVWRHGFWFWLFTIWQYALFISGIVILIRASHNKYGDFRRQVIILAIGTLVPLVGSIMYVAFNLSATVMGFSPLAFIAAGLFYALTIFRYRFLDVVPVARGSAGRKDAGWDPGAG